MILFHALDKTEQKFFSYSKKCTFQLKAPLTPKVLEWYRKKVFCWQNINVRSLVANSLKIKNLIFFFLFLKKKKNVEKYWQPKKFEDNLVNMDFKFIKSVWVVSEKICLKYSMFLIGLHSVFPNWSYALQLFPLTNHCNQKANPNTKTTNMIFS